MPSSLVLTRAQILAHRRLAGSLVERLPAGVASRTAAAGAGLTDSMPRAALLSLHARVDGVGPGAWEEPPLVQVWGLRYSAYAVAAPDVALFTLGRLSDNPGKRAAAIAMADRLEAFLGGRRLDAREAGKGLGVHPNALRYAAPTGRVLIRWDGARQPFVWTVAAPPIDPAAARVALARRYLHAMGPATPDSFADWAGIRAPGGVAPFQALEGELLPVRTPVGEAWILLEDEVAFLGPAGHDAPARLLPSGDVYTLQQGVDRELLVPEADRRAALWTSRVWPGAVLVGGELVGTWRRADARLTIAPWRRLTGPEREAVEAEAGSLPLPGLEGRISVAFEG